VFEAYRASWLSELERMIDFDQKRHQEGVERAIILVEAALHECDNNNLIFPAIDLSSALDKLIAIRLHPSTD